MPKSLSLSLADLQLLDWVKTLTYSGSDALGNIFLCPLLGSTFIVFFPQPVPRLSIVDERRE